MLPSRFRDTGFQQIHPSFTNFLTVSHEIQEHGYKTIDFSPVRFWWPEGSPLKQQCEHQIVEGCVKVVTQVVAKILEDFNDNTGTTTAYTPNSDRRSLHSGALK